MKKTTTKLKLSDFQAAFIQRVDTMMKCFNECCVAFDRYLDQSLKNMTRQKRSKTSTEYELHTDMKLTMSLKDIMSASKTKRQMTCMFAQGLLDYVSGRDTS